MKNPFEGISKPEALKYNWPRNYPRKIKDEHCIVYEIPIAEILLKPSLKEQYTDLDKKNKPQFH
jgi:Txe/YoeB family toxin of Txe-Axe toxin-antitoxin module